MKKRLDYIELAILMLVVYVLYLVCNIMTPMVIDDCSYAATGRSLAAIWERQSHDYFTWSGRFVAHSVAQFWGGIAGKSVFNFFNPLAMCLLVWLIGGGVFGCKNVRPVTLALAIMLMWFLSPDQYVTQFMIAGSMNYIWASGLMLLFVFLFIKSGEEKRGVWSWIGLALFSLLVGAWSEMYAVCVIPAGVIYLWWNRKTHPLDKKKVVMMVCYCIGAAFVVLAPGNFSRMGGLTSSASAVTPLATRLVNALVFVIDSPLPWLWLLIVALWLVQRKRLDHFWRDNSFWWLAALGSVAFGVFSGASWPRTHFPTYVFTFIMLVKLVNSLQLRPWLDHVVVATVLIAIGIDFALECRALQAQKSAVAYVKEHASEGETVPWKGTLVSRKSIPNTCFSCYPENWRNVAFSQYHELPAIRVVPQEVMDAIANPSNSHGQFSVIPLPEGHGEVASLRIVYYEDVLYIYPSKLARLAAAFGIPLNERYYTSREDAPLNGWLLKEIQGLDVILERPVDSDSVDGIGLFTTAQGDYVYYPSRMNTLGGFKVMRTEFVYQ